MICVTEIHVLYNLYTCPLQPCRYLICVTDIHVLYNLYTCPLQRGRYLTLKLLIQGHSQSAKVPHIADFKTAYISLIGRSGLQCETILWEIMGCESSDVVRFHLGPLLQGQTNIAKLRSAYNSLIVDPRGLQRETSL